MIEVLLGWDALVDAIGAVAMALFGVWVLTLKPRTRLSTMLAVFAIAGGTGYTALTLFVWTDWHYFAILRPIVGTSLAVGGGALLFLAREILEPLDARGRKHGWTGLSVVGILVVVPSAFVLGTGGPSGGSGSSGALAGWQIITDTFAQLATVIFFGAFLALLLVLALEYRNPPSGREEPTRTQALLVSAALVLWPAFYTGWSIASLTEPGAVPAPRAVYASLLVAGFVWLAAQWVVNIRAVPERSVAARNLAWLILGMVFIGLIQRVYLGPLFPDDGPLWGIIRLVSVVGLTYGILRHEVLGIDAKFRWGVSRTTVAGIFVAVFFIVSEGAQALFADFAGNEFLGVLAAGGLVFFLSPLQRMAEHVAAKAVPAGAPARATSEERYRHELEMALADGEITEGEERRLAELVEELGLPPTRAFELRREVETRMREA